MERLYEEFCIVNSELLNAIASQEAAEIANPLMNVLGYLSKLEGFKTRCKNLHWAAPKNNIHVRLDEFLEEMDEFEDSVAEGVMGILGKFGPNAVQGENCEVNDANQLISEVRNATVAFYESLPQDACWKGILSECETFIQNINKYVYLFSLSDVK